MPKRGVDSRPSRNRRVAASVVLFSIIVLLSPARAHAEVRAGWAWQAQRGAAPSLGPASGVPSGDLAVAWFGQPDKLTYVGIGGAGSRSLRGATLELSVDPDASNLDAAGAQIRACVIASSWEPAAPMGWDTKPLTVCDGSPDGVYSAQANSFAFRLDRMADALASAAVHGISIEPVEEPGAPFQVVFKGAAEIRLRLPPPPPTQTAEAPAPAPEPVAEGGDLEAYAPDAAPVPDGPPPSQSSESAPAALPVAAQPRPASRPVTLSAIYGMVAAFAGLALGGRVLAYLLRSRREDKS